MEGSAYQARARARPNLARFAGRLHAVLENDRYRESLGRARVDRGVHQATYAGASYRMRHSDRADRCD